MAGVVSSAGVANADPGSLPGGWEHASRSGRSDGGLVGSPGGGEHLGGLTFDQLVSSDGYVWWYIDAVSEDESHGVTVIAFIGSVFSPYYAWARRRGRSSPLDHNAMNVALYGPRGKRWAMTERPRQSLRRDRSSLAIGPSVMSWDGNVLKVEIDEVAAPFPNRICGTVRLFPAYLGGEHASSNGSVSQIIQAAVDAGIARGAIEDTIAFVRKYTRPWIDSKQERGSEDVFTISQIGDLEIKLHAAEALLEKAGLAIDGIIDRPTDENVAAAAVAVAEAKVLTTEIAILATNKLHELAGTRSTLAEFNLDRHWRNARTHTLHDPVRWKYFHVGNYALNGVAPPRHAWS